MFRNKIPEPCWIPYRKNPLECMVAQSEQGAAWSEDSLLDGSPPPAEERRLSQNTSTA